MKIVLYTLNLDGTIPYYILDGGYFANVNNKTSPQDYDLIGFVSDDYTEEFFETQQKLLNYVLNKGFVFQNPITDETISSSVIVSNFWNKSISNN